MLIALALPQINEIFLLEALLEADAWRALPARGSPRVSRRRRSADRDGGTTGVAHVAFLVVDLTSYAVFEHALVLVNEALIRHSASAS